jgi:hypothetical protein
LLRQQQQPLPPALANPQQQPPANLNLTINVTTATDSSHLSKFDLPDFDGNILMWNAFWDVFEVEKHQKTKYSNIPSLHP